MKKMVMMGAALCAVWMAPAATVERDIVVYGSSPAAISAAVQAKRMGKTAVIVSPETRIGGLTTGGDGRPARSGLLLSNVPHRRSGEPHTVQEAGGV